MLRSLCLKNISLAHHLHAEFGARLNVFTGDNGLGKTVLLDAAWWALTGSWAGLPLAPEFSNGASSIRMEMDVDQPLLAALRPKRVMPRAGDYDALRREWIYRDDEWSDAVVLYLQADGSFALWDAARHVRLEGDQDDPEVVHGAGQRFDPDTLWNGLKDGDRVACRGLVDDWVTWQLQRDRDPHGRFAALSAALDTLSPHPGEWMRPGEPRRVFADDARDFPTVETPYGTVPVVYASAAMKRVLGFAYLLVWAWNEHREASKLRGTKTAKQLVLLFDEVETHLHPQWQRRIMPALLSVAGALDPQVAVQFIVTTHAPLVLASLEPRFDPERDRLFLLELSASKEVVLEQVPWAKHGDAQRWLTSEVFGLAQTRSREAEDAVEAAKAFMRGDLSALPPGLNTKEALDARLRELLPSQDPFFPRWITYVEGPSP
ncbi:MAG: AAA family ATPase [Polyangiales bacterium]